MKLDFEEIVTIYCLLNMQIRNMKNGNYTDNSSIKKYEALKAKFNLLMYAEVEFRASGGEEIKPVSEKPVKTDDIDPEARKVIDDFMKGDKEITDVGPVKRKKTT